MKKLKSILKDESGQGATEYILLLAVVVALCIAFRNQIKGVVDSAIGKVSNDVKNF